MNQTGKDLDKAEEVLRSKGLVAIPTETVYGLAANALDPDAVARIFEAKNRPSFDPLIMHIASLEALKGFVENIHPGALELARKFWPGPLTILFPKSAIVPDIVTSGMPDVAVRVPDNAYTSELLKRLDFPLVAPSANPFGYISPTTAAHVADQLGKKVDYILDGGPCRVGVESTIIGFPDDQPTIYRMGGLDIAEIEKIIGKVEIRPHSTSNPRAPGMLKSHYAPHTPVRLLLGNVLPADNGRMGFLLFSSEPGTDPARTRILSPNGDLREAAKNLFSYMRELDSLDLECIVAETVPDTGLGRAINDRLRRASA